METSGRYPSHSTAPSAPELPPQSYDHQQQQPHTQSYYGQPPPQQQSYHGQPPPQQQSYHGQPPPQQQSYHGQPPPQQQSYHGQQQQQSYHGQPPPQQQSYHGQQQQQSYYGQPPKAQPSSNYGQSGGFPVGTQAEVIRAFEMVDRDRSGFIDEYELQQALSSGYQRFNLRTIRLLMFLFKNPYDSLRIGPMEFAALWSCLGHWRGIFERFDRDRSGKIDLMELRDALYSLGYAIPPSVLQLVTSKYDNGSSRRAELDFDSFVECGMIVKGLTEKFKEKDTGYTGNATFTYDSFMSTVIPFLVSYD